MSVSAPIRCLRQTVRHCIADTFNPMAAYLTLRDSSAVSLYFEHHSERGRKCYLAADPVAALTISAAGEATFLGVDPVPYSSIPEALELFLRSIKITGNSQNTCRTFGFAGFPNQAHGMVPAAYYAIFRSTYIFDLVNSSCTAEFLLDADEPVEREFVNPLERLKNMRSPSALAPFRRRGAERSDSTPEQFIESVATAQKHIQRGDIFQVVISRAFSQQYEGDELSLFRSLRNLNPSPYSFFLDAGDFKILGTSPELQLDVTDRVATVNPIAGTVSSSHTDLEQELVQNRKERAEHMMLVDLARNDLSMHCHDVSVSELAAVHHYSHVSHLVSTVVGTPDTPESAIKLLFDSAPAGTLSGAPKKRAIEILSALEASPRGFYGGMLGYIFSQNGNTELSHAILIRSLLASRGTLTYRAGAGITNSSDPDSELREIDHKLGAIRAALNLAEEGLC